MIIDIYNKAVKKDDICGTITANGNTSSTHCGTFGVIEENKMDAVTTRGKDIASTIRSSIYKCGKRNIVKNIESNLGYEGVIEMNENTLPYRIRKLTPKECFRIMSYRDEDFENASKVNSNCQLYKEAGNAIVENCLIAIFSQLHIKGCSVWNDLSENERHELIEQRHKQNGQQGI